MTADTNVVRPAGTTAPASPTPSLTTAIHFFESISLDSVAQIAQLYAPKAFFKDPFNEVSGVPAIQKIFAAMFSQVDHPSFKVVSAVAQSQAVGLDQEAFLTWEFYFTMRRFRVGQRQTIRGATHLKFDAAGLIIYHRDYWDAAEELYEKLPVLGSLMRWLKRRAQH